MNMSELALKVRELSKQYHNYVGEYSHGTATGWHILVLNAIERLNDNIESVRAQLDEINRKIDGIMLSQNGQIKRTELIRSIEERFGKSIVELLSKRKGKSVRAIADELGISKSTAANWIKKFGNE